MTTQDCKSEYLRLDALWRRAKESGQTRKAAKIRREIDWNYRVYRKLVEKGE